MDILVKHGNTNITSYVISYQREAKICDGIGRLEITLSKTYSTSISPHDTISIYENGDFKVKYYVSDVDKTAPDGTIILHCQDKSKYLVDYFIPTSYTIDYPSYTRYWIQKFFDEAGITYEFTTDSQGNLISNNTVLGLQPAYDQIMMLCQLSGWYFYFDGNGKAIVGSLTTDLSSGGSVGKTDILTIKKTTDDKMLRNRAVVWGEYDPLKQEYAYADVSTHTPYNYDHIDKRAMVVSNSNIPNKSSAIGIANILLKEFAKATITKELTVHGARNFNLGETLKVDSHVWKGKGLITTFGVTMDRGGLITNVTLDERCPRLFGFFNFGDYVYVGTFGDGVWRKHIKFDPTWYNFSTGLTNLNITDLHINNGVFGSVGYSGQIFIANDEAGPWNQVSITSLDSSVDNTTTSGIITYISFSGIMARATIVDRSSNDVKFGVDTFSGLNTGDYFLTYSGLVTAVTSGTRGWIVEYDPFTNELVGGLGSGIYPINYSGIYDLKVLDLENDGKNDYVSIAIGGGTTIVGNGMDWEFGRHFTQPFASTIDPNSFAISPLLTSYVNDNPGVSASLGFPVDTPCALVASDKQISGQMWAVATGDNNVTKKISVARSFDSGLGQWVINTTTITSGSGPPGSTKEIVAIYPHANGTDFDVFYRTKLYRDTYYYNTWDSLSNTWGGETTIATESNSESASGFFRPIPVVIGDKMYAIKTGVHTPTQSGGQYVSASDLWVWVTTIDLQYKTFTSFNLLHVITTTGTSGKYYFIPGTNHTSGEDSGVLQTANFNIFPDDANNDIKIVGWVEYYDKAAPTSSLEYVYVGNSTTIQNTQIYNAGSSRWGTTNGAIIASTRLSKNYGLIGRVGVSGSLSYFFNGLTFHTETSTGTAISNIPFRFRASVIFPVYMRTDNYYIAKDGSNYWLCDPVNLTAISQVLAPNDDYSLRNPYSSGLGPDSNQIYWTLRNLITFKYELVPYDFTNFYTQFALKATAITSDSFRGVNFGGWFLLEGFDYAAANPQAGAIYIDMGEPDWPSARYLILQRNGLDYSLIQEASKPLRIDISNNSPVLSVQDLENTFVSNYVYGNFLEQVIPTNLTATEVRDYRYSLLETQSGIVTMSGSPVSTEVIYATRSGIYTSDALTYSGGFVLFDHIPSGFAERIETTNYVYPGQFIFVTTSGESPMFYQRDNTSLFFDDYPGLPDSRVCIIRVDDRM